MTPLHEALGRRRRTLYVPTAGESVQQTADRGAVRASDPPIYRELLRNWAGRGKTLPGHRDPEWARLTAPIVRPGEFGSGEPFGSTERFGATEPFGSGEPFGTPAGAGARPPRQFTPGPGQFGETRERMQFGEAQDRRQYADAQDRMHFGEPQDRMQRAEPQDRRQHAEAQDRRQYGEPQERMQLAEAQDRMAFSETQDPRGDGR